MSTSSKAGFEMTRSDKKKGRRGGINQWELLTEARTNGETRRIEQWEEYCHTTKGRRCIEWSRNGLKKRLLGIEEDDPDDTDDAIVNRAVEAETVAEFGPNLARLIGNNVHVLIGILRAIERNK